MADTDPRIEPLGDAAVLVTFGETIDLAVNRRAHHFAAAAAGLGAREPHLGLGRPVPAYAGVLVPVDPLEPGVERAAERLAELARRMSTDDAAEPDDAAARLVELPVRYGGADGPDLAEVAALAGLTECDVVELHAGTTYDAFFLGFSPGFAYLGIVPAAIAVPRRATPRERVPAGSVGIAGEQTAVYPAATPGGWQLIGRTAATIWDPAAREPARIRPGDRVRFVPLR